MPGSFDARIEDPDRQITFCIKHHAQFGTMINPFWKFLALYTPNVSPMLCDS
jgi:hypothetical protein